MPALRPDLAFVAGIDACLGGWASAIFFPATRIVKFYVVRSLEELQKEHPLLSVIAIDMPLILEPLPQRGGRACDRQARMLLPKGRRASIFSAPTRLTLEMYRDGASYRQLHDAQSRVFRGAPGLSKQTYFLLEKIDELEKFFTKFHAIDIIESHPEVVYAQDGPQSPRILDSKKTEAGRRQRLSYFKRRHCAIPSFGKNRVDGPQARPDDWLDAAVLTQVAAAYLAGAARFVGDPEETIDTPRGRIYY